MQTQEVRYGRVMCYKVPFAKRAESAARVPAQLLCKRFDGITDDTKRQARTHHSDTEVCGLSRGIHERQRRIVGSKQWYPPNTTSPRGQDISVSSVQIALEDAIYKSWFVDRSIEWNDEVVPAGEVLAGFESVGTFTCSIGWPMFMERLRARPGW